MSDARNALEAGGFGFPDEEQPTVGEVAMVALNESGCTFCNRAFDIESGDAISLYRTYWFHEACLLQSMREMHETITRAFTT